MKEEINITKSLILDDWLIKSRDKDEESIKSLYIEMKRPIFILALSIVNDYHIAEDVLQETFIKVIKYAGDYKKGSNAKAWIFMIAKNTALNNLRKRSKEEIKDDLIIKDTGNFTEDVEGTMEFIRLIEPLEQEEKEILALRLSAGLSHGEIANVLNISVLNARTKYSRAIKKLRKLV